MYGVNCSRTMLRQNFWLGLGNGFGFWLDNGLGFVAI